MRFAPRVVLRKLRRAPAHCPACQAELAELGYDLDWEYADYACGSRYSYRAAVGLPATEIRLKECDEGLPPH